MFRWMLFILIGSFGAQADVFKMDDQTHMVIQFSQTVQTLTTQSKFSVIAKHFKTAGIPTQSDMTGGFAGRCYLESKPNKAIGTILVGQVADDSVDHGPLFPAKKEFRYVAFVGNDDPTYFDTVTDPVKKDLLDLLRASMDSLKFLGEKKGSLAVNNEDGGLEYYTRTDGKYLFMQSFSHKTKKLYSYCYFFKKVF